MAGGDLFLCPTVRLLADTPLPPGAGTASDGGGGGAPVYEYDGAGHRLVLPDKGHLGEPAGLLGRSRKKIRCLVSRMWACQLCSRAGRCRLCRAFRRREAAG